MFFFNIKNLNGIHSPIFLMIKQRPVVDTYVRSKICIVMVNIIIIVSKCFIIFSEIKKLRFECYARNLFKETIMMF